MNDVTKLIEDHKKESQKTLKSMSIARKAIGYSIVVISLLVSINAIIGLSGDFSTALALKMTFVAVAVGITLALISLLLTKLHVSKSIKNFVLVVVACSLVPLVIFLFLYP